MSSQSILAAVIIVALKPMFMQAKHFMASYKVIKLEAVSIKLLFTPSLYTNDYSSFTWKIIHLIIMHHVSCINQSSHLIMHLSDSAFVTILSKWNP